MKTIGFTKVRYLAFLLSICLITGGAAFVYFRGGFNLGIDLKGGLSLRIQIAPVALRIQNVGEKNVEISMDKAKENIIIKGAADNLYTLPLKEYPTLKELRQALTEFQGLKVDPMAQEDLATELLLIYDLPKVLAPGAEVLYIHHRIIQEDAIFAPIQEVRSALSVMEKEPSLQSEGDIINQEYIIRVDVEAVAGANIESSRNVIENVEIKIKELLTARFGEGTYIQKSSESMGPQHAQQMAESAVFYVLIALLLIMIYITFRFKITYAVGAILALIHDVAVMLGIIGALQIEVNTATVAAVLTIIGYSLNDTIVVYDRIRENMNLLKDTEPELDTIINISVTQSLSRTLITSLTTLVAVTPLYILGSGMIKDFAFSLMIGIVVGTYSSIFIASPVVLGWQKAINKKHRKRDFELYGIKTAKVPPPVKKIISKDTEEKPSEKTTTDRTYTRIQRTVSRKKKKKKKK